MYLDKEQVIKLRRSFWLSAYIKTTNCLQEAMKNWEVRAIY